jgi:cell fate regulator YaaT (PSP1 superfamily)
MALVEIEIYPTGRMVHVISKKTNLKKGDWCLYQLREGMGMGKVKFVCPSSGKTSFLGGEKIRKATPKDREEFERRQQTEKKSYRTALEKISSHKLPMKLIATKYPLETSRITFYYTAKERVDFRALVKDLAAIFKVRIQMQQIGVRDEPQVLGGCGICGRPVCCALFLGKHKEKLDSVSLEAARLQNLPLTSSKISGICGRLRCCLNFEYPTYSGLRRELPRVGEIVRWQGEEVKVIVQDILKGTVVVETKEGIRKPLTKEELKNIS